MDLLIDLGNRTRTAAKSENQLGCTAAIPISAPGILSPPLTISGGKKLANRNIVLF